MPISRGHFPPQVRLRQNVNHSNLKEDARRHSGNIKASFPSGATENSCRYLQIFFGVPIAFSRPSHDAHNFQPGEPDGSWQTGTPI
jgi:hypothetical protein